MSTVQEQIDAVKLRLNLDNIKFVDIANNYIYFGGLDRLNILMSGSQRTLITTDDLIKELKRDIDNINYVGFATPKVNNPLKYQMIEVIYKWRKPMRLYPIPEENINLAMNTLTRQMNFLQKGGYEYNE